jgi:hypothetical protein
VEPKYDPLYFQKVPEPSIRNQSADKGLSLVKRLREAGQKNLVTKAIAPHCKYLMPFDCNQRLLLANLPTSRTARFGVPAK